MVAVDDEDPAVRHIQVVAGNRSPNGSAQAFRIEAVTVPGLDEPITLAVELGESAKSVDDLISKTNTDAPQRVDPQAVQATILHALATGEKSRTYLDQVCADDLGATTDTVYDAASPPSKTTAKSNHAKTEPPAAGTGER